MNNRFRINVLRDFAFHAFCIGLAFLLLVGCKKEKSENHGNLHEEALTVTDIDGNIYSTIKIGTQLWLVENLRTTKYRNGDPIPVIKANEEWSNSKDGAFCYYENDESFGNSNGLLYNWYVINDSRGIAPKGWHVPTNEEWKVLTEFLGGDQIAGGKLKGFGTEHGEIKKSGFSALLGGFRNLYGQFFEVGITGCWWTSTASEDYPSHACNRTLYSNFDNLYPGAPDKSFGFSLRCLKD